MDLSDIVIQTNFSTLDWFIVVIYLLIIVGIGVYIRRYVANVADFMVAGRGLKTFLAVATMIGTELGLVTVMYSAQKGFTGGFAAFHIALAAAIVTLIVGLTGFIVVPLRRMNVMTIPEFYEKRFGRNVRIFGGAILAFSGILNMGLFLKSSSFFITGVTGMTEEIYLKIIMTVLLIMVLLYTTLGGMVSVVVLDYIQFVVLSVGLLFATLLSIKYLGWSNIVQTVVDIKGPAGFNPVHEKGFGLSYVVWQFFGGLASCAIWQTAVIRACAAESTKVVKRLYTWSSIGFLIRFLIPYFLGISAFVYVSQHPDLKSIFLPDGGSASSDITMQAMPIFLGKILPVGFIGIVTAGMLAAFMSTQDSYLLCWSSVLTQDVVAPLCKKELSSKARIFLTRIFLVLISIFTLVWGLWYSLGQDLWDYMIISGAIYTAGAAVVLTFGIYWKRASTVGAYLAIICGFCAIFGLEAFRNKALDLAAGLFSAVGPASVEKALIAAKDYMNNDIASEALSAIIGLSVLGLAIVLMVVGSLLFPDRKSVVKTAVN